MPFKKKTQKKIDQATARAKAKLKYLLIGPQGCTVEELKDLASIDFFKKVDTQAPLIETYLEHHENHAVGNLAPEKTRKEAIDFLQRMTDRYVTKAADQMKADILSTIDTTVGPIRDRLDSVEAPTAKEVTNDLKGALNDITDRWQHRLETIARTELNRAANWGAMDSIIHNNKDKEVHEITVYKRGNPSESSCPYCQKFWFLEDGITPRVYRMSELMGQTNIGKKKEDWTPSIDITHPNESHFIREIPLSYGFKNGELTYIDEDHDEWKYQRGVS